jgi:hypothetical protein
VSTNEGPLSKLNRLLGIDADLAPIEAVKRITETPVSLNHELFYSTRMRREMQYDRIPIGCDLGYRCYNSRKHDPDSAYQSGEYGDGITEDEAYADWLRNVDVQPPRIGVPYAGNGNSEPYEYKDDPVDFDYDLEDPR